MVGLGVHAAAGDKVGLTDIRNAAIDITVDMFIDSCAQKLGVEYKLKEIDYLTHKFGHFGVGAFKGAISNLIQGERVLEGALVGGAAGAGAEILGEKLIKVQEIRNEVIQEAINERRPIVGDEYIAEVNKRLAQQTDFIKIAMAGVAAIAGQNPHLGADCAANALENNFLAHIVGGAAGGLAVALEAAGVVEAGAVANVIWGALGTGILITGCEVAKENLPGSSSPFEESSWINGPIINGTPIADAIPALEGYQSAPQDYNTTITITPVADAVVENEGYQAAPQDVLNYKIPGFTPVDVPGTFIMMNEESGDERKYWTKEDVHTFKGQSNKVYKRDDLIDLNKFDPKTGLTNRQKMERGLAPVGPDNHPINLHHTTQQQNSPLAEVTKTFHQEHKKIIHINPPTIPSGINRGKFDSWRENYWKERVKKFEVPK